MILAELVSSKKEALRVKDLARLLDVSIQQIYKLAAKGQIPTLKIANSVRFDPHEIADWIKSQSRAAQISSPVGAAQRRAASRTQKSLRI